MKTAIALITAALVLVPSVSLAGNTTTTGAPNVTSTIILGATPFSGDTVTFTIGQCPPSWCGA